jgi:hypothetical protein
VAITYNTKNVEEFFTAHPSQNIIANQLASYVKRKNAEENFLQKIVNQNGFAHWDKTMQKEKNTFRPTANGDSTDVHYVPIAQPNTAIVNASVVITTTPTDTTLGFTYDWQYTAQASSNTIMGDAREQFAATFMYMNKVVFWQSGYTILDPTLFIQDGHPATSIKITSVNSNNNTNGLLQQQTCIVITVGYTTCPNIPFGLLCDGKPVCDRCDTYCTTFFSTTICTNECTVCGAGGGGTTGTGNGNTNNNGNTNTGNGNTGGSGSGTTTNGGNTNTNGNTGNTGWVPNGDEGPLTPCDIAKNSAEAFTRVYTLGGDSLANTINVANDTIEKGFFIYQTFTSHPTLVQPNGLPVKVWGGYVNSPISLGTATNVIVKDSVPPLPIGVHTRVKAMGHTHCKNGYAAQSADDIYRLLESQFAGRNDNNVNNKECVGYFVKAADGSKYAITITDTLAAKTFLGTRADNLDVTNASWKRGSDIEKEFASAYEYLKENYENSGMVDSIARNKSYEMAMSAVLKKFNTGVTLNKADLNGNFKPIIVNTVTPDPNRPRKKTYTQECI